MILCDFWSSRNAPEPQEIQVLLSALIDFTEMHFRTEEELMLANSYKGFAAHKAAHTDLLEQANLVKREFSAGAVHPCHMLALFIQSWVTQHIVGPDKEFFAFLASKRASGGGPPVVGVGRSNRPAPTNRDKPTA